MPAKSEQQWKLMQGICSGSIPPKGNLTRKVACEYIKGQSPKGLPKKKKKKLYRKKS